MEYLNRSGIVVYYKKPFHEWIVSNGNGSFNFSLSEINRENIVYLIEEYDDLGNLEEIVKSHHKSIFKDVMKGWCKEKSKWPEKMSLKLFNEWFELSAHSRVKDLESIPIEKSII